MTVEFPDFSSPFEGMSCDEVVSLVAAVPDALLLAVREVRVGKHLCIRQVSAGKWTVCSFGSVIDADGRWEYSPLPSSCSSEFIARTRHSVQTALRLALEASEVDRDRGD
jgi:hypothetical protein